MYLFSFDHANIIRDTAVKAYGVLMEKTDPDEEENEKIREFLKYLEDLDRQIFLARDFISRQHADHKLSSLEELTSPNKAKERKERIKSLLAKKTKGLNKIASEEGGNNTLNSTLLEPMEEFPDAVDVTDAVPHLSLLPMAHGHSSL